MTDSKNQIAESLDSLQTHQEPILVQLSNELIHLLSDQLYQSPLKAIEELVVNSYDADASECFVYVPTPDDTSENQIVVFDNGAGMSYEGLVDLWHIGNSTKREKFYQEQRKRKQIGKFGIGKLATYTIADHLTYISKVDKVILAISINFNSFKKSQTGASEIVQSPVRKIDDLKKFLKESSLGEVLGKAKVDEDKLSQESWTIAILESLKEKAKKITEKRLLWILRTAMPLKSNFTLYLNGEEVTSSKDDFDAVVTFNLTDLPDTRLDALEKSTGETWERKDGKIVTPIFPNGISGEVIITEKTLHGKSDDLERSHGFFIRVLGRLVNETDSLFGLKPLEHGTFNRFRADIDVDDLDNSLKASREAVEESLAKEHFRKLLQEVFNEANRQYYRYLANKSANTGKTEGKKNFVLPNFVEVPIADVLTIRSYENGNSGSEADNSWFYLEDIPKKELNELIRNLYQGERKKYSYEYRASGETERLVKFDPQTSTFWLNQDHDLVHEYMGQGISANLLEDLVTAEAMLEVYLREANVSFQTIGEVLEKRDGLFKSLAKDRSSSLSAIGRSLRDAAADQYELEISLVVVARALGFVANQISNGGEPDGVARFMDYPSGEKKITLEAKSSNGIPHLPALDFAGLVEHRQNHNADGCLLVAPGYPGQTKDDNAVNHRATDGKISCWTISILADFVEAAESRRLTARNLLDIVLTKFTPTDVEEAVKKLLEEPNWDQTALYGAILDALKSLEGKMKRSPRSFDMVMTVVAGYQGFELVEKPALTNALLELASASQGGMTVTQDEKILLHVGHEELERRLSHLTRRASGRRRASSFRNHEDV